MVAWCSAARRLVLRLCRRLPLPLGGHAAPKQSCACPVEWWPSSPPTPVGPQPVLLHARFPAPTPPHSPGFLLEGGLPTLQILQRLPIPLPPAPCRLPAGRPQGLQLPRVQAAGQGDEGGGPERAQGGARRWVEGRGEAGRRGLAWPEEPPGPAGAVGFVKGAVAGGVGCWLVSANWDLHAGVLGAAQQRQLGCTCPGRTTGGVHCPARTPSAAAPCCRTPTAPALPPCPARLQLLTRLTRPRTRPRMRRRRARPAPRLRQRCVARGERWAGLAPGSVGLMLRHQEVPALPHAPPPSFAPTTLFPATPGFADQD